MKKNWIPTAAIGLALLFVGLTFITKTPKSPFNINGFGTLPVLNGGRIKPMESVARTSLLMISGKQSLRTPKGTKSAPAWLLDVLFNPAISDTENLFQIDDPDVLGLLGIQQTPQRRFSFNDVRRFLPEIENQAFRADSLNPRERSRFESAIIVLHSRLFLYHKLQNTLQPTPQLGAEFLPIPLTMPDQQSIWVSFGEAAMDPHGSIAIDPAVLGYKALADAYPKGEADAFNAALKKLSIHVNAVGAKDARRVKFEFFVNQAEPFYTSIVIYVVVFLLAFVYILVGKDELRTSAAGLMGLAFLLHTFGLLSRMIIQGRPPVTNLYSSAIFVGWVAVLLGLVIEKLFRRGIGSIVASFIGFTTLIIAHNLASQGDTLEMMRAVLDSNFWLATHVITVTVGYGSTFISGVLGAIYLFRRLWDKNWNHESAEVLSQMVYGVICFNTFFSFLGTILGGIWADQSWGRFWGWDPKENGALMIVLWNIFILHGRVGKLFSEKTVMMMAVFGNVITALSWFGVNMLGIGLHSYGFMDKASMWLMIFVASQCAIVALGFVPKASHGRNPSVQ